MRHPSFLAAVAIAAVAIASLPAPTSGAPVPTGNSCATAQPIPVALDGRQALAGVLPDNGVEWWTVSGTGNWDIAVEGMFFGYYWDCDTPTMTCEGGAIRIAHQLDCSTAPIIVMWNFGYSKMGSYAATFS